MIIAAGLVALPELSVVATATAAVGSSQPRADLAGAPGGAVASPSALTGVHVFGWGFNSPVAIASDGTHVWVANAAGQSVTEFPTG